MAVSIVTASMGPQCVCVCVCVSRLHEVFSSPDIDALETFDQRQTLAINIPSVIY